MKKNKPLCEYSKRGIEKVLHCTLDNNQGCKFVRYCTQDSMWWNSSNFTSCGMRKQEMSKRNRNKFFNNEIENKAVINSIYESNIDKNEKIDNVAINDVSDTIEENNSEQISELIEKDKKIETKVEVPKIKRSIRKILY